MKRFPAGVPLRFIFFLTVASLLFQGCARHLQTYPASEQDIRFASTVFARYRQVFLDRCRCCLDAEVDAAISVAGWFGSNTANFSGNLQARDPANIKFVALNPLGQPVLILTTDGNVFQSLNVFEGKAYAGTTRSETFRKFVPPGLDFENSYYWLTGGMPPGEMNIVEVSRDRENKGFWLQIEYAESAVGSMILFDPVDFVMKRHIIINDSGDHLVDLAYDKYLQEDHKEGFCRFPTNINISSVSGANRKMELKLYEILPDAKFTTDDLEIKIPDSFELLIVN